MQNTRFTPKRLRAWLGYSALCLAGTGAAQNQQLDFDRPEAWAMAQATVASIFSGPPPQPRELGELVFTAELTSIPHVSSRDSVVGFNGSKFEDLNKSPVFGRGRLLLGLPWQFAAEFAYTPPVELNDSRADGIYGLALERSLWHTERWQLGARVFAQEGHVEADVTCPRSVVAFGVDDIENNPFGCLQPSNDDAEIDHYGGQLSIATSISRQLTAWGGFAVSRLEPQVQVDALLASGPDRALLRTEGTVRTTSLGLTYQTAGPWQFGASASYTPLTVRRPPERDLRHDDSVNVRLTLGYRLR